MAKRSSSTGLSRIDSVVESVKQRKQEHPPTLSFGPVTFKRARARQGEICRYTSKDLGAPAELTRQMLPRWANRLRLVYDRRWVFRWNVYRTGIGVASQLRVTGATLSSVEKQALREIEQQVLTEHRTIKAARTRLYALQRLRRIMTKRRKSRS